MTRPVLGMVWFGPILICVMAIETGNLDNAGTSERFRKCATPYILYCISSGYMLDGSTVQLQSGEDQDSSNGGRHVSQHHDTAKDPFVTTDGGNISSVS